MKSRCLIIDCYYDERGAALNFEALLGDRPTQVVRAVFEEPPTDLSPFAAIFITGSKGCLSDLEPWMEALMALIRRARDEDVPLLGICFGHQAIACALFGTDAIRSAPLSELGWETIRVASPNPLFEGLSREFVCFLSHFDEVSPDLEELEVFAHTDRCPVQAYQVRGRRIWGVQFHPEMDPAESEALVRSNLARHSTLENDPEAILGRRLDGRALGRRIFESFLRLTQGPSRT